MTDRTSIKRDPKNLEERLEHLEEVNRFTLEVLDMAASIGNFQASINRLHDPSLILNETRIRLERLIPFECTAFFLVDEASSDFHLFDCAPVDQARRIQHEVDYLIDDGSFARALMADKPVFVYCRDDRTQLLLHVLATTSRVRGMFVGIPVQAAKYIKDVSLSLLSIVLLNSSNALESFELYRRIREFNIELEDKVGRLTLSEKELMVNRSRLEEAVEERTAQLQATVSRLNDEIAERKKAEELLAGSQKLLQNVFRAIPDLFMVQDKDLRIVMSNCLGDESTPQIESLPKRHCYEVYAGCASPCAPCPVKEVFASGSMKQVEAANLAEGTIKEIRAFPILNDAGEVVMAVEHIRDITEKRRMEEELLKAQKLESVGVLAGGIAHDFNNLLTVMLGNISLARMDKESPERILERLSDTERACLRARDLTMQLLTFSRGGSPIKKTVPMGNILRDASIFALRGSGVKCQFILPEDLWSAEVDEGQISQVISNLIINACQAMPNGGEIRISARNMTIVDGHALSLKEGNYIQASFADSGIGIPDENISRIFDPYFTTKSKGNGLGLATAYSIIQKHGGLLTAESQPGSGATFTFYLPASDAKSPVLKNESVTLFSHKRKVLLMDDEALVRDIACKMLTYMGYEVCQAEDGAGAVALYQEALDAGRPFDAVIMDLTVPGGMGGREAIGKLLEIDPNARAIASSGYADDPTMAQFDRYGYKGIVAKPYKVQELSEALHLILGDE